MAYDYEQTPDNYWDGEEEPDLGLYEAHIDELIDLRREECQSKQ